jgi:hypothetical protein
MQLSFQSQAPIRVAWSVPGYDRKVPNCNLLCGCSACATVRATLANLGVFLDTILQNRRGTFGGEFPSCGSVVFRILRDVRYAC